MCLRQPGLQRIAALKQVHREANLHLVVDIKISTHLYFLLTSYFIKYGGIFPHIVFFSFYSL
jgi:hypothetical protein